MATLHEDLTSQIDGVTDTFVTLNDISQGVVVGRNGQLVSPVDVTILTSTSFQPSFVPKLVPNSTDTLGAFITPDRFDISSQVDGVKTVFDKDPTDLGQGDFLAILNGQILADETRTINNNTFQLPIAPQAGDTLEYFRVIDITQISCSDIVLGIVNIDQTIGIVNNPEIVLGIIKS